MNVLFVANDATIFDAQSSTRARMRAYAAAIGTAHVVSRAKSRVEEVDGPLVLHGYKMSALGALLWFPHIVRSLVRKNGIEVASAQDPFEYGWIALQGVRGTKAKLHVQVHTDFLSPWFTRSKNMRAVQVKAPFLNRVRIMLADKILPHASGVRVVSKRIADSITARYGDRVSVPSVIPIAVPMVVPDAVPLPPHNFSFALITAGRLEPEKRIEDILMAMGRIALQYPSLGLFIVGEGSERSRLEKLVQHLGLEKRVIFTGWRTDQIALMRSAQAYIQASAYEGYGRTLVEAALARIPIITTDVGIVGEVFKGYTDVLSAPPADPTALSVHIMNLIEDHALRTSLLMSAEQTAKKHLAAYEHLPELIAKDLARIKTA